MEVRKDVYNKVMPEQRSSDMKGRTRLRSAKTTFQGKETGWTDTRPAASLSFTWKLIFYLNFLEAPMPTVVTDSFPITTPFCFIVFCFSHCLLLLIPYIAIMKDEPKERIGERKWRESWENMKGRLRIWHATVDATCCHITGLSLWS